MMDINESNFRLIRYWSASHKRQLKNEFDRNVKTIKDISQRNKEIISELESLYEESQKIAELELESEAKFLAEIERNCKRCKKLYDKRQSKSEDLCPSCFTSNA